MTRLRCLPPRPRRTSIRPITTCLPLPPPSGPDAPPAAGDPSPMPQAVDLAEGFAESGAEPRLHTRVWAAVGRSCSNSLGWVAVGDCSLKRKKPSSLEEGEIPKRKRVFMPMSPMDVLLGKKPKEVLPPGELIGMSVSTPCPSLPSSSSTDPSFLRVALSYTMLPTLSCIDKRQEFSWQVEQRCFGRSNRVLVAGHVIILSTFNYLWYFWQ